MDHDSMSNKIGEQGYEVAHCNSTRAMTKSIILSDLTFSKIQILFAWNVTMEMFYFICTVTSWFSCVRVWLQLQLDSWFGTYTFFFCNNLEFAFSALLCFLCSGDVGQLATFMHTGNRWLICFFVAFFHSSTFSCKSHTPKANTNGWFHFVVFKNVTSPKTQIKLWMKLTSTMHYFMFVISYALILLLVEVS